MQRFVPAELGVFPLDVVAFSSVLTLPTIQENLQKKKYVTQHPTERESKRDRQRDGAVPGNSD